MARETKARERDSAVSDEGILRQANEARARQRTDRDAGRVATAARYDDGGGRVVVEMSSGIEVAIPVKQIPELRGATVEQLEHVTVDELGAGLHWEALDVDVSVLGLLTELLGERTVAAAAGRAGGRVSTDAKAAAARENGAKGGRPRKTAARRRK